MRSTTKRIVDTQQKTVEKDKSFNEKTGNRNLDLNDLLKRLEEQKSKDKKFNVLIFSTTAVISLIILLILSL